MEFKVRFIGENGKFALNLRNKETGMEGVDAIRTSDLNQEYDLEIIHPLTDGAHQNPEFILTEEHARDTCQFLVNNSIIVVVTQGFLNKYAYRFISRRPTAYKDIRYQVSVVWKVNELELISNWLEMGAPLFWETEAFFTPSLITQN